MIFFVVEEVDGPESDRWDGEYPANQYPVTQEV
jgi:hypothetical protein